MANVKNAKAVSSNRISSIFGDGVILNPNRTSNNQSAGGFLSASACITCCISTGCGSSNKIKVDQ